MSGKKEKIPQKLATQDSRQPLAEDPFEKQHHLDLVGQRIAAPETSIRDAVMLTRIRDELIRQEEYGKDREHLRTAEKRQFWCKLVFSGGAVCTGAGLMATGHPLEGFAVMGIGFHWLAPDFVKSIYERLLSRETKQNGK